MAISAKKILPYLIMAIGLLTLANSIIMMMHQAHTLATEAEAGLVIAFEFTPNSTISEKILQPAVAAKLDLAELLSDLRAQIYLDFSFICCYVSFFVLVTWYFYTIDPKKFLLGGLALSAFMLIGDGIENGQMLQLFDSFNTETGTIKEKVNHYTLLLTATWLKWGSLSLMFLLFADFFRRKNILMTVCCVLPFLSGLTLAAVQLSGELTLPGTTAHGIGEINFLMIVVGLLAIFIWVLRTLKREAV